MRKIRKVKETTLVAAQVINGYSDSENDGYACSYINDLTEDSYSLNEVKTNKTWISGEPIYRKVLTLRNDEIHGGYYEYNHNINNLSQVLNIYGMCYSSTRQHPIQRAVPDAISTWGIGLGDIKQSTFALHFGTGYQDINLVYIVIEYTKTIN